MTLEAAFDSSSQTAKPSADDDDFDACFRLCLGAWDVSVRHGGVLEYSGDPSVVCAVAIFYPTTAGFGSFRSRPEPLGHPLTGWRIEF